MAQQFIYTMMGVRKVHPPDNEVIKDLSLSFFLEEFFSLREFCG